MIIRKSQCTFATVELWENCRLNIAVPFQGLFFFLECCRTETYFSTLAPKSAFTLLLLLLLLLFIFCNVFHLSNRLWSYLKDPNTGLEQETKSGYVPKLHSDWRRLEWSIAEILPKYEPRGGNHSLRVCLYWLCGQDEPYQKLLLSLKNFQTIVLCSFEEKIHGSPAPIENLFFFVIGLQSEKSGYCRSLRRLLPFGNSCRQLG